jgi:hypothetical protein
MSGLPQQPRALLVLKDGHVGSEWFAETISRQPGTRFVFEMGPCIGGSIVAKRAFFGTGRHACACGKEECAAFRGGAFSSAPCLDAPSRTACRLLGGSIMSVTDEEARQWQAVLSSNSSDALVVVQTRSNLAKWAWSFYRTGAMKRLRRRWPEPAGNSSGGDSNGGRNSVVQLKEQIHRRESDETPSIRRSVHVDPAVLLRMIWAKQARSERLLRIARQLARRTGQRRERVVLYEAMQADAAGELSRLFAALRLPFDVSAHHRVPLGVSPLLKHATENLSSSIANWAELEVAFRQYPCLHEMLVDTHRRAFDDCGGGAFSTDGGADPSAPCACSWRTPSERIEARGASDTR